MKKYYFEHWVVNGKIISGSTLQLTPTGNVTLQAVYGEKRVSNLIYVAIALASAYIGKKIFF